MQRRFCPKTFAHQPRHFAAIYANSPATRGDGLRFDLFPDFANISGSICVMPQRIHKAVSHVAMGKTLGMQVLAGKPVLHRDGYGWIPT